MISSPYDPLLLCEDLVIRKVYLVYTIRDYVKFHMSCIADFGENEFFLPKGLGRKIFLNIVIMSVMERRDLSS